MQIYEVGGAVRDRMLGKEPNDHDYVVVGSNEVEMKKLGFIQVGSRFPVFLHPITHEEYALARREKKTGPLHTDFEFIFDEKVTLEEDLMRRDFTCNALAYDIQKKISLDFHNSEDDIKNKILRHVSEHFKEDPLRVLRMCRFSAQLDFKIAPETMKLAKEMVRNGELKNLSPERIFEELEKALKCPKFFKFIETSHECGALKEILPEVDELWNVPERPRYHPEKISALHIILCLKKAEDFDAPTKFAVLLHDIGKTLTSKESLPMHVGHDLKGEQLIRQICARLKIPNKYRDFAITCAKNHMQSYFVHKMDSATLIDFVEAISKQNFEDLENFIRVCFADAFGTLRNYTKEDYKNFGYKAEILRNVFKELASIHANDMPNFEKLKKDASFKKAYREYRASRLGANRRGPQQT